MRLPRFLTFSAKTEGAPAADTGIDTTTTKHFGTWTRGKQRL